ncbi:CPBP family glutamic-type intramembrane protease [Verrucomicrobiota bacterium sgz303538]
MWLLRPVRLEQCSGLRQFARRILAQQFLVKILVAVAMGFIVPSAVGGQARHIREDPLFALLFVLILAPVLETLVLQSAMIEPFRLFRRSRFAQFLAGAVPFAALHFFDGITAGIAGGVIGGMFFSHAYLECRARSWWAATKTTAATHFLHNLIVTPIAFASALMA